MDEETSGARTQEPQQGTAVAHSPDDLPQPLGTAVAEVAQPDATEAGSCATGPEPVPAEGDEGSAGGGAGEDCASACDDDAAEEDFYAATIANLIQHPLLHQPGELADGDPPPTEQSGAIPSDNPQATPEQQDSTTTSESQHEPKPAPEQPTIDLPLPAPSMAPPKPPSLSQKVSSTSASSRRTMSPAASSRDRGPSPPRYVRTPPHTAAIGQQPSGSSRFAALRPSTSPDVKPPSDAKSVAKRAMDRMPTFKGVPVSDLAPFEPPAEFDKEDGKWYTQYMKAVISKHKEKGGGWTVPMRLAASVPGRFRTVEMQPPSAMEDAQLLDMPKPALHTAFQAYMQRHAPRGRTSTGGGGAAEQQQGGGSRRSAGGSPQVVRRSRELPLHDDKLLQRQSLPSSPANHQRHQPAANLQARGSTAPSPPTASHPWHHLGPVSLYQAKKRKEEKQHEQQLSQRHHEQRAREMEALRQDLRKHSRWSSSCLPQQHVGPPTLAVPRHSSPLTHTAPPVPGPSLSASAALCLTPRRLDLSLKPTCPTSPTSSQSSPPHSPRFFDLKASGLQNRMLGYPSGDSYTFTWAGSIKEPAHMLTSRSLLPTPRNQRI